MRKVLWLILILSLIFLIPLINLRISNEISNNAVILAWDYQKFLSNREEIDQLKFSELKKYGISSVMLKEDFCATNTELLESIKDHGLEIILNLKSLNLSGSYCEKLEELIKRYKIQYLLVYDSCEAKSDSISHDKAENIEELAALVNRNNLIIFVMENKEQTGYMPVLGLDTLIIRTDYSLNRAFAISQHKSKVNTGKDAYMMWIRAVVDRNIRLICVEPLFSSEDTNKDNQTLGALEASKELSELLLKKGFHLNTPIKKVNARIPDKYYNILLFINITAAMALFLDYSGIKRRWLIIVPVLLALLILGFIIYKNNIWVAFASAIIYPSLSNTVLLKRMKSPSKNLFMLIITGLLLMFIIIGIGVCIVIASMCDVRYTMGVINFDLVIPAFIIPLIMFNINFTFILLGQPPLFNKTIDKVRNNNVGKFIISNLVYVFLCSALISVYLIRSGNFNILPELSIELKMRGLLELVMSARPRTKEFLIAYPCLFGFLYLHQKKASFKILSFLGTLSSIIGISIINSFSHGFTPVLTSLNRTFNGLFLGAITGCLFLSVCWFFYRILKD